jgi:hypothetical protein
VFITIFKGQLASICSQDKNVYKCLVLIHACHMDVCDLLSKAGFSRIGPVIGSTQSVTTDDMRAGRILLTEQEGLCFLKFVE